MDKERQKRKMFHILDEEIQRYNNTLAKVRNDLSVPTAPAMPVVRLSGGNGSAGGAQQKRGQPQGAQAETQKGSPKGTQSGTQHQENLAPAGFVSEEFWALVHTSIAIDTALKIPAPRQALDKEWSKLEKRKAWLLDSVREYDDVESEARKNKRNVHRWPGDATLP